MREIWGDAETAERLEREAAELKRRFNQAFWVKGRRHYALALVGVALSLSGLSIRQANAGSGNGGSLPCASKVG